MNYYLSMENCASWQFYCCYDNNKHKNIIKEINNKLLILLIIMMIISYNFWLVNAISVSPVLKMCKDL